MKTTNNRVLFVVLNFNGWKDTIKCINSIFEQSYKNYHVLLIDNGSVDDSLRHLSIFKNKQKITLQEEAVNHGFAGGVNIGIEHAIKNTYGYVALLNNDAVLTKDWLKIILNSIRSNRSSICTGLLLDSSGKKIESTGDSYSNYGLPYPRQRDDKVSDAMESGFVFGGTAGASVYTTELFEDIGFFDEKFFAYYEDTDISYRAQLAGHKAYYEKSAIAYHDHGTTSNKMPGFTVYQTFKNLPVFLWKDVPYQLLICTAFRFYSVYFLMYLRAIMRGQFAVASKGLVDSIKLLPHAFKQRRIVQKKRKVSIRYIKSIIFHGLPPNKNRKGVRIFHK